MFMSMLLSILCARSCIRDVTLLNHCHFRDEITAGGQEMKLSWRSLRPCWLRMHCSPRLMSVEHCNASQDSSLDIISANLFQQEYWLELTAAALPAPVSIALWKIRYHRMQILSFKTFCRWISQRFRLRESELYICFHILPNTLVGERSITPLQSFGSVFLLLSECRFLTP